MHLTNDSLFNTNRINSSKKRLRPVAIFVAVMIGVFLILQCYYWLSDGAVQTATFSFNSVGEPTSTTLEKLADQKQRFSESGEYYVANGLTLRKEFSATDEASGGNPLAQFVAKGIQVEFVAKGILVPIVEQKENSVAYRNAYADTDIVFEGFVDHLAEKITLRSATAPKDFAFKFSSSQQLLFEKDARGGIIAKNNNKAIFYVQPPVARDAAGKKLSYAYDVRQDDNGYLLEMRSDDAKQFAKAQYPISIE